MKQRVLGLVFNADRAGKKYGYGYSYGYGYGPTDGRDSTQTEFRLPAPKIRHKIKAVMTALVKAWPCPSSSSPAGEEPAKMKRKPGS